MTGKIQIGTASWTDKSLLDSKLFYPRGCNSAEDRLRFYASQFPLTEVDSSYYALPSERNAKLWVERTPQHFVFNVKAFRLFTGHQTPALSLPADIRSELASHFASNKNAYYRHLSHELRLEMWRRFKRGIEPLRAAGKLCAVHFQFPPWIRPTRDSYALIEQCAEHMGDYQLSLEFRHFTWFDNEHRAATLEFLRRLGAAHTILDMPQGFDNSIPQIWEVTTPKLAIIRYHGRNAASWNAKDHAAASDRFNYDYADDELEGFIDPILRLTEQVDVVQNVVNVNYEYQGIKAAKALMRMIEEASGSLWPLS